MLRPLVGVPPHFQMQRYTSNLQAFIIYIAPNETRVYSIHNKAS
jgi:hypothetical protein